MIFKYLLFPGFLIINSTAIKPTTIIKNSNIPSCKNCIHFEPYLYNIDDLSRCNKFGEKNIITDEIKKDYTDSCRKDEKKCGFDGKYFEKETDINLRLKFIKNYWKRNSPYFLVGGCFILYIYSIIYTLHL